MCCGRRIFIGLSKARILEWWDWWAQKMISGKNLERHFLSTQQALEEGGLGNAYWPPGKGSPDDGLTNARRDMVPPLRVLESGRFQPGQLRHLNGVARKE